MTEIAKIVTSVNPQSNGGESLLVTTEFHDNGDDENNIFLNQTITLHSYCNSASFHLVGAVFTPEVLREMADAIEAKTKELTRSKS